MKRPYRIFNQWRGSANSWCFVPFSIWGSRDFWGFVLFNFCFEWPRTEFARLIHQSDPVKRAYDHDSRRVGQS